ncbi:MAG: outer membrane beta-barrel protein [Gammaproteobacteria bacterium]|nr:outer membrane beta-barrel protein [Gammaproteobacteria bacterium]
MRFCSIRSVLFLLLLIPASASAWDVDVYGGMSSGFSVREQKDPANDHVDGGEKIYFGTRFLGPIGLEFTYYNLGKFENETTEVRAMGAAMLFNFDVRGMTVFAKGGIVGWEERYLLTSTKEKGQDVMFGLGINLAVDKHVLFRTEIERFRKVGKDDNTGAAGTEMTLLSFGVNFRF